MIFCDAQMKQIKKRRKKLVKKIIKQLLKANRWKNNSL